MEETGREGDPAGRDGREGAGEDERMIDVTDATLRRRRAIRTLAVGAVVVLITIGVVGIMAARRATPEVGTSDEPLRYAYGAGPQILPTDAPPADQRMPLPDRRVDAFGDGPEIDLASYRGRPLVLNFWASWCAPCVEEMPDFNRVAAEMSDQVAFLGVDVKDAARRAEPFVTELGITYDLAVDPDAELYGAVEAVGMPTTLFVDAEGTIVFRHLGPLNADKLRDGLRDHLGVEGR